MISFEWDENKDRKNIAKHGVSFEEASTVFEDPGAILLDDPEHSKEEDRFLLLGFSVQMHLLIVCHCYREKNQKIRIISARKATHSEAQAYNDLQ